MSVYDAVNGDDDDYDDDYEEISCQNSGPGNS